MTHIQKLFVALWIIMILRIAGAWLGGRQALRLREITKYREVYEWFTALGFGMVIWGFADFALIWRSIFNDFAKCSEYSPGVLWYSISIHLIYSLAIWTITLAIFDGRAPGRLRTVVFWCLNKLTLADTEKKFNERFKVTDSGITKKPNLPE